MRMLSFSEPDIRTAPCPPGSIARRQRGGLLVNVLLGMALLGALVAGAYASFQQAGTQDDIMRVVKNSHYLSNEVRALAKTTAPNSGQAWSDAISALVVAAPSQFDAFTLHLDPVDSNIFELRFSGLGNTTCRRLRANPAILGPGLMGVRCRNADRVFIAYQFARR